MKDSNKTTVKISTCVIFSAYSDFKFQVLKGVTIEEAMDKFNQLESVIDDANKRKRIFGGINKLKSLFWGDLKNDGYSILIHDKSGTSGVLDIDRIDNYYDKFAPELIEAGIIQVIRELKINDIINGQN